MAALPILWGWVLAAAVRTGATSSLVEQRPKWALVRRGQAETLQCFLKDTQYPRMSWYQQGLQGQLQVLASLRFSGDKEVVSLPGAEYQVMLVDDKELRLHVANVTQGRTLYCSCSKDTVLPSGLFTARGLGLHSTGVARRLWRTRLQAVALPSVSCGEDVLSLKLSF